MNSPINGGASAPLEPCTYRDTQMIVRVAQALTDVTHDSIVSQHQITSSLIKRMGMIAAHIEHIERLIMRDTREQYEGELEQAMSEYRFLDSFISTVEKSNDQFVDRMKAIQAMWDEGKKDES